MRCRACPQCGAGVARGAVPGLPGVRCRGCLRCGCWRRAPASCGGGAMSCRFHRAGQGRRRDGLPYTHPISLLDSRIHRTGPGLAGRARRGIGRRVHQPLLDSGIHLTERCRSTGRSGDTPRGQPGTCLRGAMDSGSHRAGEQAQGREPPPSSNPPVRATSPRRHRGWQLDVAPTPQATRKTQKSSRELSRDTGVIRKIMQNARKLPKQSLPSGRSQKPT